MFLHLTTGEAKRFSAIDTIFFGLDGKSRGRGGGGGGNPIKKDGAGRHTF